MQAEEVRELSDAEIRDRLNEFEEERFRLRFRAATETLDDPLRVRVIRREVARMKTILRERDLEKAGKKVASPAPTRTTKVRASAARGGKKSK